MNEYSTSNTAAFPSLSELRQSAKAALAGNTGRAALATLISIAISGIGDSFTLFNDILPVGIRLFLATITIAAVFFLISPIQFGFKISFLQHLRGEEPNTLPIRQFQAFRKYPRFLGVSALFNLYIILWALLMFIPIGLYILGVVYCKNHYDFCFEGGYNYEAYSTATTILTLCFIPLLFASMIPMIVASYSYYFAAYIMYDHPELSAKECLRTSKQMLRGWKWKLFCLDLSYLGWLILTVLTLGVLSMWITPRMECAHALFYEELRAHDQSTSEFSEWSA